MTPPHITSALQDSGDTPTHDDAFLAEIDDEALERALKTVHWHPKDVAQFLRATTPR